MNSRVSLLRIQETMPINDQERDPRTVYGAYSKNEMTIIVLNETWAETEWNMYAAQFKKLENDNRWVRYPVLDIGICDYDLWNSFFELTNRQGIEFEALRMVHETEIFTQRYSRSSFGKYTFAKPSPDGWSYNFNRWYMDTMVEIDEHILRTITDR